LEGTLALVESGGKHPWAGKIVTLGFMGTYRDDGAEIDAVALVGKQRVGFKSILRLFEAD